MNPEDAADYFAELHTRLRVASGTAEVAAEHAAGAEQASQWIDKIKHYRLAHERYRIAVKILDGVLADWPTASSHLTSESRDPS